MRTRITVLIASLVVTVIGAYASGIDRKTHTDSVLIGQILREGDWRYDLAGNCLRELIRGGAENKTSHLLQILSLTDFDLTKITIKEIKQKPERVRFGFEFNKRDALKTVYWEAECPVDVEERELRKQTTTTRLEPTR